MGSYNQVRELILKLNIDSANRKLLKNELIAKLNEENLNDFLILEAVNLAASIGDSITAMMIQQIKTSEVSEESIKMGWEKVVTTGNCSNIRHYKNFLESIDKKPPKLSNEVYQKSIMIFKEEIRNNYGLKRHVNEYLVMLGLSPDY
ncbi:MAG TPA: hypothetical protein VI790_03440 [Candidatus Nanoarchaeia archaeon]|nr:hypothetical protein [Candidatus Nanoarchaeia archaeon]